MPPLSTQTTFEPGAALTSPLSSAATGAAAAPSTTSLQRDMIQITASKICSSGERDDLVDEAADDREGHLADALHAQAVDDAVHSRRA